MGHDPTTRIRLLLDFGRPIFIGVSSSSHVSIRDSPSAQLNRDRRILLTPSTALKYTRVLIAIKWIEVHEIYVRSSARFDPTHLGRPRHLNNITSTLVPHRRREAKITSLKGESCGSSFVAQWPKYAPPCLSWAHYIYAPTHTSRLPHRAT